MDLILKDDAIEVLSKDNNVYGTGKQEAISIIKSWNCETIYLDFVSKTCVIFINADNQDSFKLSVDKTVH